MPEFLSRRFGPLPAWGWAALGAGGFILYRYWKNRQTASASGSSAPTSMNVTASTPTATPDQTATYSTPGGFSYSGPVSALQGLIPPPAAAQTASSNATTFTQVTSPTQEQGLLGAGLPTFAQLPGSTLITPVSAPSGPMGPWQYANTGAPLPGGSTLFFPTSGVSPGSGFVNLNPTPTAPGVFAGQ